MYSKRLKSKKLRGSGRKNIRKYNKTKRLNKRKSYKRLSNRKNRKVKKLRRKSNKYRAKGGFVSYTPLNNIEGFNSGAGPLSMGYSPLPCDGDGKTDWDSKNQVGHETCVEYGADGAEKDSRAGALGAGDLSEMKKNSTIEQSKLTDAEVDKALKEFIDKRGGN